MGTGDGFKDIGCGGAVLVILGVIALLGAILALEAWFIQWVANEAFNYGMSFKGALGVAVLSGLLFGRWRTSSSK